MKTLFVLPCSLLCLIPAARVSFRIDPVQGSQAIVPPFKPVNPMVAKDTPLICIDPGHPSEVSRGTRGRHVTEMRVAWNVALKLRTDLEGFGYRVVLTKDKEDEMVTNRKRAEIANHNRAALMLRLHLDAASGTGFSSYYPDRQGSVGSFKGPSPSVIAASRTDAKIFHKVVVRALSGFLDDRGLHTDQATAIGGQHGGALIGSVFSKVPVVLVEMAVLTNPRDEAKVASASGQQRLADALAQGVRACVPMKERKAGNGGKPEPVP